MNKFIFIITELFFFTGVLGIPGLEVNLFHLINNDLQNAVNKIFSMLQLNKNFTQRYENLLLLSMHASLKTASEKKCKYFKKILKLSKVEDKFLNNKNRLFKLDNVINDIFKEEFPTPNVSTPKIPDKQLDIKSIEIPENSKEVFLLLREYLNNENIELADIMRPSKKINEIYKRHRRFRKAYRRNLKAWVSPNIIEELETRRVFEGQQARAYHNPKILEEEPDSIGVRVGSEYPDRGGDYIGVTAFYFNPTFQFATLRNNLAILRASKVKDAFLIKLSKIVINCERRKEAHTNNRFRIKKHLHLGHTNQKVRRIEYQKEKGNLNKSVHDVIFIGWGDKDSQPSTEVREENQLSWAQLELYNTQSCMDVYTKKYVTDKNFCAGFSGKGAGACQRDAGGPAIVSSLLVGVVSFGPPVCGTPDAPTVFTNLGHHVEWIDSIVKGQTKEILSSSTIAQNNEQQKPTDISSKELQKYGQNNQINYRALPMTPRSLFYGKQPNKFAGFIPFDIGIGPSFLNGVGANKPKPVYPEAMNLLSFMLKDIMYNSFNDIYEDRKVFETIADVNKSNKEDENYYDRVRNNTIAQTDAELVLETLKKKANMIPELRPSDYEPERLKKSTPKTTKKNNEITTSESDTDNDETDEKIGMSIEVNKTLPSSHTTYPRSVLSSPLIKAPMHKFPLIPMAAEFSIQRSLPLNFDNIFNYNPLNDYAKGVVMDNIVQRNFAPMSSQISFPNALDLKNNFQNNAPAFLKNNFPSGFFPAMLDGPHFLERNIPLPHILERQIYKDNLNGFSSPSFIHDQSNIESMYTKYLERDADIKKLPPPLKLTKQDNEINLDDQLFLLLLKPTPTPKKRVSIETDRNKIGNGAKKYLQSKLVPSHSFPKTSKSMWTKPSNNKINENLIQFNQAMSPNVNHLYRERIFKKNAKVGFHKADERESSTKLDENNHYYQSIENRNTNMQPIQKRPRFKSNKENFKRITSWPVNTFTSSNYDNLHNSENNKVVSTAMLKEQDMDYNTKVQAKGQVATTYNKQFTKSYKRSRTKFIAMQRVEDLIDREQKLVNGITFYTSPIKETNYNKSQNHGGPLQNFFDKANESLEYGDKLVYSNFRRSFLDYIDITYNRV